jgi:integrase/recombinase XerD
MVRNEITTVCRSEIISQVEIENLVKGWVEYLRSEKTRGTTRAYMKGLNTFLGWLKGEGLPLAHVVPSTIRRWRDSLVSEGYSPDSVSLWLTAVRRFYAFLINEYDVPILNPAREVKGKTSSGNGHKRDELTSREVMAVLETCEDIQRGKRDRALIGLMAYSALRTIEVHRADLKDLQTKGDRLILWVHGKQRVAADEFVVISEKAHKCLHPWLIERGKNPGPLFTSLSNRSKGTRLGLRSIRAIVMSRYCKAGVVGQTKSTHSLRHSAITNAIRNGADPKQVMQMARHKSFNTTLGYYHEVNRLNSPAEDLIDYGNGV